MSVSQVSSLDSLIPARTLNTIVRKNLDGTFSVINLKDDDNFYSIEGLAAEVWKLIDGKTKLAEIKKSVLKKHSPPAKLFERDVTKFIAQLKKDQLIELRKSPASPKK